MLGLRLVDGYAGVEVTGTPYTTAVAFGGPAAVTVRGPILPRMVDWSTNLRGVASRVKILTLSGRGPKLVDQ